MKYHAKIEYAESHYYWNHSKEKMINNLLIPFINGQVVLISSGARKKLLNLKNVSRVTLYKTSENLTATEEKSIIDQIDDTSFYDNECTEELIKESKLDLASQQSLSLLQKTFLKQENRVFVIMKFNDKILDSVYEGVIKPIFEKHSISVVRVDEIQNSGKISDQILELISSSKYVFSDLTGSRPNCYYETGFAHAIGKEIILSCHKNEQIHFDLSGYRFIVWETENELRRELEKRIKSILE
jgi:hypothetical protein